MEIQGRDDFGVGGFSGVDSLFIGTNYPPVWIDPKM